MFRVVAPGSSLRARDRGATAVEYTALLVLAALILGALVAAGIPGKTAARTDSALCTIIHTGGSCGGGSSSERGAIRRTATRSRQPGDSSDGPRSSQGAAGGGCHGFWGCLWSGATHVAGGAWGAITDIGSGIEKLFTTNPLTTAKSLGRWLWTESPVVQTQRASRTCGSGDTFDCVDSSLYMTLSAAVPGGGLIKDMVVDDKAKQDLKAHHWADASGRSLVNAGTLFLPTKLPFGKLAGALGRDADDVGDASKAGITREGASPGETHGGKLSDAFQNAGQELRRLRDKYKNGPKHSPEISPEDLREFTEKYRALDAAERTKYLSIMSPWELRDIYRDAVRIPNLQSDLLESVPESDIKNMAPKNPGFPGAHWVGFSGKLWRDHGPVPDDVRQGAAGDCWCLAAAQAAAANRPAQIENMITKNVNGTYTVQFRDGPRVTVTNEFPVEGVGFTKEAGWPTILEKAVAVRAGGYRNLERLMAPSTKYQPNRGLNFFARRLSYKVTGSQIPAVHDIAEGLRQGDLMTVAFSDYVRSHPGAEARGIVDDHAYAVVRADPANKTITLANPWGPTTKKVTLSQDELKAGGIYLSIGREK